MLSLIFDIRRKQQCRVDRSAIQVGPEVQMRARDSSCGSHGTDRVTGSDRGAFRNADLAQVAIHCDESLAMIDAGATRLGTSASVAIINALPQGT